MLGEIEPRTTRIGQGHMGKEQRFRSAIIQLRSTRNVATNVAAVLNLVEDAARAGAQYVLTPENTTLMELESKSLFKNVAPESDNPALQAFRKCAEDLGVWLHIGGMPVALSDNKIANRGFLISDRGEIEARYDKIHMFDVDLPNGENYRESKNYEPGDKAVLADLPWGRLGLTICYDLRFPYLYRALAQEGAEMIAVPSAFTKQTGEAHWHILLRARAIETGCFVFAAAQGGFHECERATYGHSLIISPWGEVLAEAGAEPGVIFADIDLAEVKEARQRIPTLRRHRKFQLEPLEPSEKTKAVS